MSSMPLRCCSPRPARPSSRSAPSSGAAGGEPRRSRMTLAIDLFRSFRSPYSYLATGRLVALARDYDVAIAVRPVLPIALRDPDKVFGNPLAGMYIVRD